MFASSCERLPAVKLLRLLCGLSSGEIQVPGVREHARRSGNRANRVVARSISWRDCSTYSRYIIFAYGAIIARNNAILDQELATDWRSQTTMTD